MGDELGVVAARDRELAELRGLLADLCEDSRAAATAMRYQRALELVAHLAAKGGPLADAYESTAIFGDRLVSVARKALEGEA